MSGYPQHKSDAFKQTLGRAAFAVFSSKGEMRHNLAESIPGSPRITSAENADQAFERFRRSMMDFQAFGGALAPHFAYGPLNKAQYENAHAMHFYNHLEEIQFA